MARDNKRSKRARRQKQATQHAAKTSQSSLRPSTWYAWYLVCESFYPADKNQLSILCLVSKAMKQLASPFLHRSVRFMIRESDPDSSDHIVRRLKDASHDYPRVFVQEITFGKSKDCLLEGMEDDSLSILIERLPNLRRVRLEFPCDFDHPYIKAIEKHPNKPEIHLLKQDGFISCSRKIPAVTVLSVDDATEVRRRMEWPPQDNFLNFVTSFPNLKSCTWKIATSVCKRLESEIGLDTSRCPKWSRLDGLDLPDYFPRIASLCLDKYYLGSQISPCLQDHFKWSSLLSLELGPSWDFAHANLQLLTGRIVNLRHLRIRQYDRKSFGNTCPVLEKFLMSFDTLTDLDIFGKLFAIHAITRHTGLVNLCLQTPKSWCDELPFGSWGEQDLISLDASCPQLKYLELYIRPNKQKECVWDVLLDTIACNFANLVVLRLDCISDIYDRGIDWRARYQSEPYSTVMEAKKNGSRFYAKRYRAFNQNSQSPEVTGQSERLPTLMLTAYRNNYGYLTRNGLTQMTVDILPPKTVGKTPILYYTENDYYIGDQRKSRLCGGPPRPRCYNEVRSLLMG
ncbi:unnamed protein product [Penicillium salamii]|uniref:F-box domain-containing protein n=1 Tax=Penicillium salamii TaxID=1612424 RepID=A0A9W4IIW2_9EURO|nr:unnamed protein product [Penicillium salamii]CAG8084450.1 unnamed protein product [Penicillium salamii]CAG8101468.1 unnamed protein product [Penicillium salamii]CAG8104997.1 unnamed protein product [Penicillium salamii]CAG8117594.1 unnamed protein product [Penicillium salamii]